LHRHLQALTPTKPRDDRRDFLARPERRALWIRQELFLAKGNRTDVLHGAGCEIGNTDDVQLAERIRNAGPLVVELHRVLGGIQREAGQRKLVGRRTDAHRDCAGRAAPADEIAHEHGDQITGNLLRAREGHRVLAGLGPRRIGHLSAIGDRAISTVDHQRHVEGGFVGRLVPGRKRATGIGRFHLGDGVPAAIGFAQVEAAKLVVEDARECDVD